MKTPQWLRLIGAKLQLFLGLGPHRIDDDPVPYYPPARDTEPLHVIPVVPPAPVKPQCLRHTNDFADTLFELHNQTRASYSMAPLVRDVHLDVVAERHCIWMAENQRKTHSGKGGCGLIDRLNQLKYRVQGCGENLACGQVTAEDAVRDWFRRPNHRENILGNYSNVGFAVIADVTGRRYWCAVYALGAQEPVQVGHVRLYHEPEPPRCPGCVDTAED